MHDYTMATRKGLTLLLFLFSGTSAIAQQATIDHCKQTSSDADRIACLEAALLGKQTPVPEPAPETAAQNPAPQGIGADQVIARNETREEQLEKLEKVTGLIVAGYEVVPYEKLEVTLENGQVWRQIKGDTQKVRVDLQRNQTVNIEESSLGGYKMHLNEMRRTIRVERIQ